MSIATPVWKRECAPAALVFVSALAVYWGTMPRSVPIEDAGLFVLFTHYGGVAHPPGYPLFTLLAKPFASLPGCIGELTFRVALMSAVFAAATASALYICCRFLFSDKLGRVLSLTAALAYAFSRTLWSQAVIAEVYSLSSFLFFTTLALCLAFHRSGRIGYAVGLCLGSGLALSNHYPLFLLSAASLPLLLVSHRAVLIRNAHWLVLAGLVGLVPYAFLYVGLHRDATFSFSQPLEPGLRDFWFYVSRKNYAGLETSPSATWIDKGYFLLFILRQLATELGFVGAGLALVGCCRQWRRTAHPVPMVLTAVFLGSTLLLVLLLGFDYDYFYQSLFRVYPIIAYGVWAIWLGFGLEFLVTRLPTDSKLRSERAVAAMAFVIVLSVFMTHIAQNNRRDDTWGIDFARATLESLPPNAIYFTEGDQDLGAIAYASLILGVRPDVAVYNTRGVGFDNRLVGSIMTTREASLKNEGMLMRGLLELINGTSRPVFFTDVDLIDELIRFAKRHDLVADFHTEYRGLYVHAKRGARRPGIVAAGLDATQLEYFMTVLATSAPDDEFSAIHREAVISKIARTLTAIVAGGSSGEQGAVIEALLDQAWRHYLACVSSAHMLYISTRSSHEGLELLDLAESRLTGREKKSDVAKLETLRGMFKRRLSRAYRAQLPADDPRREWNRFDTDAEQHLLKSIDRYPNPRNDAVGILLKHYDEHSAVSKKKSFVDRYPRLF